MRLVRDEALRRQIIACIREEQSPLSQPAVQPSSRAEHCNRLPSRESQVRRQHLICGRWQRQRRLAQQLCQRLCQPLNSVPSDPLLPRAAIAVAKGAQRSLEQWKEKLDWVQVRFDGFAIALLASAALSDELCRHFQHASAQLQRELGVGRPVCWRLALAHLPELRLLPICARLEEQVNHVASLFCSLLCHCVVLDEREEPLGVNKFLRAATPLKVLQREGHWELLKQDHGYHLGRVHKQRLLTRLGKVDEPQRVAHVDQDIAAVEVAVLVHAEGLVVGQPGRVCGLQQTLKLLKQAHEGLARVFVAPHSRVAVVDQAVLELLCLKAVYLRVPVLCEPAGLRLQHLADAAIQQRRRIVTLC
eukprot:scaffold22030_cov66-Phaeocystis_antarctica.AAC.6